MRKLFGSLLCTLILCSSALASAYNGQPRLVVVIVIDQFRGDYLARYHDEFGQGGFRLFMEHGAFFTDCNFNYANTETAPGHSTLFTGAYSDGHGIFSNQWWDPATKHVVTSVEDSGTTVVGGKGGVGSSPHNLMASTLGDELKLATQGKSRVFGIALKDRAAILPAGWSGDGAYWIDKDTGAWITSTYYRKDLPDWVQQYNQGGHADKYWNREWKDANGHVLRTTTKKPGGDFYSIVGSTGFGNEYELEFARELIRNEKLGTGPATDLLAISLSPNDLLGHALGPDSPEIHAMALELDHDLGDFFSFLGKQVGMEKVWLALSADHGVAPIPEVAQRMRIPAKRLDEKQLQSELNTALRAKLGHAGNYVVAADGTLVFLSQEAFGAAHVSEAQAEEAAGEALVRLGMRSYFTKKQLERGAVPNTSWGKKYLNSYSPYGGWWVKVVPPPFEVGGKSGTGHGMPYTYDTHVPLAFFGSEFQPGSFHTHAETIDLAPTLASALGINAPSNSVGRVLTEALVHARIEETQGAAQ